MRDRSLGVRAVGSILMTGVIDVGVIERDQMGPLRRRQSEPGYDLIYALFIGKVVVEMQVVSGPRSIYLGLGAGPEETGAAHALPFRQDPQRGASIPASVALRAWVAVG